MKHRFCKRWLAGLTISAAMSLPLMAAADTTRAFIPMGMADFVGVIDLESRQVTPAYS